MMRDSPVPRHRRRGAGGPAVRPAAVGKDHAGAGMNRAPAGRCLKGLVHGSGPVRGWVVVRPVAEELDGFAAALVPPAAHRAALRRRRAQVTASLDARLTGEVRDVGSMLCETGVWGFCDLDALAVLPGDHPAAPEPVLHRLAGVLHAAFPGERLRDARPAVAVEFAGARETVKVTPAYRAGGDPQRPVFVVPRPGGGWLDTAPSVHLAYVADCDRIDRVRGGARKLAMLAKEWKFTCAVPISSMYLEMSAARHVAAEPEFDAMVDLCHLLEHLILAALGAVPDPSGVVGPFRPCSSEPNRQTASAKLRVAAAYARAALAAHDAGVPDEEVLPKLSVVFGGQFPALPKPVPPPASAARDDATLST
jgi:hypothetical protein